jgi:hypothetical protein
MGKKPNNAGLKFIFALSFPMSTSLRNLVGFLIITFFLFCMENSGEYHFIVFFMIFPVLLITLLEKNFEIFVPDATRRGIATRHYSRLFASPPLAEMIQNPIWRGTRISGCHIFANTLTFFFVQTYF